MLKERAESVVKHLLPNAKIVRGEAHIGDLQGNPGDSVRVCVNGPKTGAWSDFASGSEKGRQLISLWHSVRGNSTFPETMKQVREFLGVRDVTAESPFSRKPSKVKPSAVEAKGVKKMQPAGFADRYLVNDRKLTAETLAAYRMAETNDGSAIFFPSFSPDGKTLQMGKFLALERLQGKKKVWTTANSAKVLFGKQAVTAEGGDLYITEGEIDAMSLFQIGRPAVSVPFGAKEDAEDGTNPNDEWIENDFEWLEQFTRIYLCFDSDTPGQRAAASISKRLGIERCYMVKMPAGCKDANEALIKDMAVDLDEEISWATPIDPQQLKNASVFQEPVWNLFTKTEEATGIPFIIPEMEWRIRPCELTIWTGFSGSGKSEVLNHLMIHLGSKNQKCCIASFEMPAATTLRNMVCQASARSSFTESSRENFDRAFEWISDRVWLVDRVGRFSWKDLLEIFKYARKRYGITQFVVDSLLRCGIANDDYEQQKNFTDALVLFAMENDCHAHLVAHSKKKDDDTKAAGKMDVKGSGDITDLAHNVISIFRNRDKERKIKEAKDSTIAEHLKLTPDGHFDVLKQRATGEEPKQYFYFIKGIRQFAIHPNSRPIDYLPRMEEEAYV